MSRPLFGRLPVARLIRQDLHSAFDYLGSLTLGFGALLAADQGAQICNIGLGCFGIIVSALTDCRLSLVKLVPIEVHESLDYILGFAAIALPFVFGFAGTSPLVALLDTVGGATLIAVALVTDYRSWRRA